MNKEDSWDYEGEIEANVVADDKEQSKKGRMSLPKIITDLIPSARPRMPIDEQMKSVTKITDGDKKDILGKYAIEDKNDYKYDDDEVIDAYEEEPVKKRDQNDIVSLSEDDKEYLFGTDDSRIDIDEDDLGVDMTAKAEEYLMGYNMNDLINGKPKKPKVKYRVSNRATRRENDTLGRMHG